jgi:large subunit ribosomal protein L34
MTKHTLNGTRRKVIKTSGFRARIASKTGRKVLKKRRNKGRWKLALLR